MRVISKKICLDELVSKIPGSIPSIKDAWTVQSAYTSCDGSTEPEVYYTYSEAVRNAARYGMNPSKVQYLPRFVDVSNADVASFEVGNYGLIPSDVILPTHLASLVTDFTDYNVNIPDDNGGYYDLCNPKDSYDPHYVGRKIYRNGREIKVLSYRTLLKWYMFFKDYRSIVDDGLNVFENAVDYYNKVIHDGLDSTKAKYVEMDEVYKSRGGDSVYEWITSNCILRYEISAKYRDYWNKRYLYYVEVLKWAQWFAERAPLYSNMQSCSGADDCEDCVEYRERGGNPMYESMRAWLTKVRPNANATMSASVTIPINMQTSIDDLGEMSILSKEWKSGESYQNYFGEYPGTVVKRPYILGDEGEREYLEDTYIIKSGIGYKYSDTFYDCEFEPSMWTSYMDRYISNNPELFKVEITSYTYSPITDEVVYNPTDDSPKLSRSVKYQEGKIAVINNGIYPVIEGKYVTYTYSNSPHVMLYGRKFPIVEIEGTDVRYVIVNGVKYYAEADGKFYFSKVNNCVKDKADNGCVIEEGEYILYQEAMQMCEGGYAVTYETQTSDLEVDYEILDGYFIIDGNYFYVKDGKVVDLESIDSKDDKTIHTWHESDDFMKRMGWKSCIIDGDNVGIVYEYTVYEADKITGTCESKLELFRRTEVTSDKMGNILPGYFNIMMDADKEENELNSKINEPYDGCWLDLLYYVGYATNMTINVDLSDVENKKFYADGDILNEMDFYSLDEFGGKQCELKFANDIEKCLTVYDEDGTEVNIHRDECKGFKYSDHNADFKEWIDSNGIEEPVLRDFMDYTRAIKIQSLVSQWYTLNKGYTDMETHCDFTYYLGCVIEQVIKDKALVMYKLVDKYNKGVKYVESAVSKADTCDYHFSEDNVFTVNYYRLMASSDAMYSDINASNIDIAPAVFEFSPMLYGINKAMPDGELQNASDLFEEAYWARHNGFIAEPLFRRDFDLGSSTPPKIDSDIYIDRGVSAALDRHIRLQEIKTLNALLQYGNGAFKISEN